MYYENVIVRNNLTVDAEFAIIEGFSSIILETDETEKKLEQ